MLATPALRAASTSVPPQQSPASTAQQRGRAHSWAGTAGSGLGRTAPGALGAACGAPAGPGGHGRVPLVGAHVTAPPHLHGQQLVGRLHEQGPCRRGHAACSRALCSDRSAAASPVPGLPCRKAAGGASRHRRSPWLSSGWLRQASRVCDLLSARHHAGRQQALDAARQRAPSCWSRGSCRAGRAAGCARRATPAPPAAGAAQPGSCMRRAACPCRPGTGTCACQRRTPARQGPAPQAPGTGAVARHALHAWQSATVHSPLAPEVRAGGCAGCRSSCSCCAAPRRRASTPQAAVLQCCPQRTS